MRKTTLTERQAACKVRQTAKPRRGRKRGLSKRDFLRRRVLSRFLIMRGWTAEQVAARFNVNPEAVKRWMRRGCPLVDEKQPKAKPPQEELRPYFEFS